MTEKPTQRNTETSTRIDDISFATLTDILADTTSKDTMSRLLVAMLTDKEQAELVNRLKIFALLAQGVTHREIAQRLGVGVATVSRGAKAYRNNDVASLISFE